MAQEYAKDYTRKELIAAFIANDLEDGLGVLVGANLPVPRAGVLLAHLTHGPNMRVIISFTRVNLVNEPVLEPFEFITDWRESRWAEAYYTHSHFIDYIKRYGMNEIFFIGGLQFDRYGNSNLIGIGDDYKRAEIPRTRRGRVRRQGGTLQTVLHLHKCALKENIRGALRLRHGVRMGSGRA